MATLLLTWVSLEKAHYQACQGAIQYLNPTPSSFNYQLQHPKRYIIITIIMCIITFIIIITIPEEEINGGSWSSNVKQTLCSQFNNKTKTVHRTQDEWLMVEDLTSSSH